MIGKKVLRLRDWIVEWNFAGKRGTRYLFTESDARGHLDSLTRESPVVMERYPDHEVERYYGFSEGKDHAIEIRRLQAKDAIQRYPRVVAQYDLRIVGLLHSNPGGGLSAHCGSESASLL